MHVTLGPFSTTRKTIMSSTTLRCALFLAALAAAFAAPAQADSVTSSASSAGSASSGSISDSIGGSSNSSKGDKRVAAGDYKVIDVAQAPAKANTTRLILRAAGAGAGQEFAPEFTLDVPDRALAARQLAAGAIVHVNQRVYGYEFAYADTRQSFFLALQDDWYRELGSRQVTI
jgi:type IV secretory pathway TrbL component